MMPRDSYATVFAGFLNDLPVPHIHAITIEMPQSYYPVKQTITTNTFT